MSLSHHFLFFAYRQVEYFQIMRQETVRLAVIQHRDATTGIDPKRKDMFLVKAGTRKVDIINDADDFLRYIRS